MKTFSKNDLRNAYHLIMTTVEGAASVLEQVDGRVSYSQGLRHASTLLMEAIEPVLAEGVCVTLSPWKEGEA